MALREGAPPFRCAAFSITSKANGSASHERWLVNPNGMDWDGMFSVPRSPGEYEEEAFRKVAAESGWRLVKTVLAGQRQRRLYYERDR
ncbi:MAG TPA: hypothetical protein VII06_18600 [Chloroflexota bacterium]|jgi:hypothetical protein